MSTALIDYARTGRRLDGVPVFDCHAHIDRMANQDPPSLEEQVAEMERVGIDVQAVSSILAINGEFQLGNDNVAKAIARYPKRIIGYCHVSANYPELMVPELERCFQLRELDGTYGFRGIKVYQVGRPYDDPLFDAVWEFAKSHEAPVLAHTWGGSLTGLDAAAERHPEVNFLAGHAGSAFAYEPYLEAAERCPNFFLDLTYSREHTNMIEYFVGRIGADRLVWGTDAPTFSISHQVSKILFARISDQDKRKILYDTAARLFGVEM